MIKRVLIVLFLIAGMFYSIDVTLAGTPFGNQVLTNDLTIGQTPLVTQIKGWINWLLGLLYFIAVVYGLYGGWNIMTAGGDDKKVGTGKTIITNAVLGLIVIFAAQMIVGFIFNFLGGDTPK